MASKPKIAHKQYCHIRAVPKPTPKYFLKRYTLVPLVFALTLFTSCKKSDTPNPAPEEIKEPITPEPEFPEPVPEPEPEPEPIPEPKIEPEIVIDPMEWILSNWRGRINNITVTAEQTLPVYLDKQHVGDALLPVGQEVPLQIVSKDSVTILYLNSRHVIPIDATDLNTRATQALEQAKIAFEQAKLKASEVVQTKPANKDRAATPHAFLPVEKLRQFVDDPGIKFAENPPMELYTRIPPKPPEPSSQFEVRSGFTLIETLDEFRAVTKKSNQKIRMKPGIYRAKKTDDPIQFQRLNTDGNPSVNEQDHIFAVTGSNNYFDLRGVVFETPVSVQSTLKRGGHIADSWHINGANNTFEGGYFRNVLDKPYPDYFVTENEFEICNDGNTFLDCTFVIKGSIPFGYTDFYGKGAGGYGRLNKHSFMSFENANNTSLIGCKVYMNSFGHALHFHKVDGVLIKDCLISGALRPTNDIFKEKVGRAVEKDFEMVYRSVQPIPRDWMIPMTEDAIRSYNEVKNVTVIDTTVERQRGCFQLLLEGDITLENVAVIESGDFSYDLSSGTQGKTVMKNCFADVAYNPVFNLTRGDTPTDAFYEVTILSPRPGTIPTERSSLGIICGDDSTFILHDGTTTPLPDEVNKLICGGRKGMNGSTITNYTTATLILESNVRDCRIKSVGPVIDKGKDNRVSKIQAPEKKVWTPRH